MGQDGPEWGAIAVKPIEVIPSWAQKERFWWSPDAAE